MIDLRKTIDSLEKKADESELISDLATDPETRTYNAGIAKQYREMARQMREQNKSSLS